MKEPGIEILRLENRQISVSLIPALGGKVISLYDKESAFECLFQNSRGAYRQPGLFSNFSEYDASGFDDAFPNIEESVSPVGQERVHFPDHGEIWSTPMHVCPTEQSVRLSCQGRVLSYSYEKEVALEGRGIRLRYRIINQSLNPMPCLWTMHCLVNCDPDTRLLLPAGPHVAENVLAGTDLGEKGRLMPVQSGDMDLTALPAPGPEAMRKFYLAGRVSEGKCGFIYPSRKLRLMLNYDVEKLPYLGFWCTMGGYRGDRNAALEPSSGYYDSIDTAQNLGTLRCLSPQEEFCFEILLKIEVTNR